MKIGNYYNGTIKLSLHAIKRFLQTLCKCYQDLLFRYKLLQKEVTKINIKSVIDIKLNQNKGTFIISKKTIKRLYSVMKELKIKYLARI